MIYSICEAEQCLLWIAGRMPDAAARIYGTEQYAQIHGKIRFYQRIDGVFVMYQINGLPRAETTCGNSGARIACGVIIGVSQPPL